MNLFWAIVVFTAVAYLGENMPAPVVGDVEEQSAAFEAGFKPGDTIVSVGGKVVATWDDAVSVIHKKPNERIEIQVRREGSDEIVTLTPKATLEKNENVLSTERFVGAIGGLTSTSVSPLVGISDTASIAAKAGMGPIELIESINGQKIEFYRQIGKVLESIDRTKPLTLVSRKFSAENPNLPAATYQFDLTSLEANTTIESALGLEDSHLFLFQLRPESPAFKAGLKAGDKILSIAGKQITRWQEIVEVVKNYEANSGPLNVMALRQGESLSFNLVPEMTELLKPSGAEDNRFTIGIVPAITLTASAPVFVRQSNPLSATMSGLSQSWKWSELVVLSFVRMIQNEVSAKNIGGVITIGKYAGQSYQVGLTPFLKLMAIISINLFVLNLLPVPILDGGHLLFFTVEAIRGAPLSMKKMEIAQQVGLIILMSLMVFALFNDISNILNPPW